jgi:hypothetical protein
MRLQAYTGELPLGDGHARPIGRGEHEPVAVGPGEGPVGQVDRAHILRVLGWEEHPQVVRAIDKAAEGLAPDPPGLMGQGLIVPG